MDRFIAVIPSTRWRRFRRQRVLYAGSVPSMGNYRDDKRGGLRACAMWELASAVLLISASLTSTACGGEETAPAPQTTETPAVEEATVAEAEEPSEAEEVEEGEADDEEIVAEAEEVLAEPALIVVPDYASAPFETLLVRNLTSAAAGNAHVVVGAGLAVAVATLSSGASVALAKVGGVNIHAAETVC
jgi:hypothetical protein